MPVNGLAKRLMGAFALTAVVALGSAQAASAQGAGGGGGGGGGAQAPADPPVIAYRKAVMQANVQHVAALRALLNPANPIKDNDAIKLHAAALENQGKMFAKMWPEGSMGPTSRSKAEIWSNNTDFVARITAFADAGKALDEAAVKGDNTATLAAVTALNATCGACHMPFRGPPIAPAAPAGGAPAAPAPN